MAIKAITNRPFRWYGVRSTLTDDNHEDAQDDGSEACYILYGSPDSSFSQPLPFATSVLLGLNTSKENKPLNVNAPSWNPQKN